MSAASERGFCRIISVARAIARVTGIISNILYYSHTTMLSLQKFIDSIHLELFHHIGNFMGRKWQKLYKPKIVLHDQSRSSKLIARFLPSRSQWKNYCQQKIRPKIIFRFGTSLRKTDGPKLPISSINIDFLEIIFSKTTVWISCIRVSIDNFYMKITR